MTAICQNQEAEINSCCMLLQSVTNIQGCIPLGSFSSTQAIRKNVNHANIPSATKYACSSFPLLLNVHSASTNDSCEHAWETLYPYQPINRLAKTWLLEKVRRVYDSVGSKLSSALNTSQTLYKLLGFVHTLAFWEDA